MNESLAISLIVVITFIACLILWVFTPEKRGKNEKKH